MRLKVAFLFTDMYDAQEHLGFDEPRQFVAALFLTKHNVVVTDFSKLKYNYKKTGIVVEGEISKSLEWK